MTMTKRYVVMTAAACMPSSCWGRYRRVAVVEVRDGAEKPKQIRNTKTATGVR